MDLAGAAAARLDYDASFDSAVSVESSNYAIDRRKYREIEVRWDRTDRIVWADMAASRRPSFTFDLMTEFRSLQLDIRRTCAARPAGSPAPFDYFVSGSRTPGIYNLGGDLGYFIERIRAGDIEAMRRYAYGCVEGQHENHLAFGAPIITMALVRGDALGGGFEFALSFDLIVAERGARFGLPEVLFNLFPGMGAYSFISRRLDRRRAEELILSGRVHTAEEMYELGLVDILAEDDCGEQAVRDYVTLHRRRFNMQRATYEARRRVNPVSLNELRSVVELWADTAMNLSDKDLKVMARLTAAQDRRMAGLRAPLRTIC